jgi:hypothetical protein
MENDWRHSQCSKVELNLRVTGKPEVNFSIGDDPLRITAQLSTWLAACRPKGHQLCVVVGNPA